MKPNAKTISRLCWSLVTMLALLIPQSVMAASPAPAGNSPSALASQADGLVPGAGLLVIKAPSGPDVTTNSTTWTDLPHMNGAVALDGPSDLAITFCAEAQASNNDQLHIRVLVDDATALPAEVVLASGLTADTRCFTFVQNGAGKGAHTIQIQWRVLYGSGTAYVGDRTTQVSYAQNTADSIRMLAVAAPNDATQLATSGWSDVPDMNGQIVLSTASDLAITFSAETYVTDVANLFIRALVDGQPASPGDEVLVVETFSGTRSFTFIRPNLAAGSHEVYIQWILSGPGEGRVNDRTLKVVAVQNSGSNLAGALMLAAPSGVAQSTTSTAWVDVPDLSGSIDIPAAGDLTMTFSGEIAATAGKRVFLRALIDGQPANPSDVRLFSGGSTGSYAYSFIVPNVDPGSHTVQIQWLVESGGQASVGDRTLSAFSYGRPNQAAWSPLLQLDLFTSPAIAGHSDKRLYVAAITTDGHMYSTSSESPCGWEPWQSVGPEHSCPSNPCQDPAYHFDPLTQPVFLEQDNTLYLFARGNDDNLYEIHRIDSSPWSGWQQITTDGHVLGRISAAFTQSDATSTIHIVHVGPNDTVEYRRYGAGWVQQGSVEHWTQAADGVIATDGVNEVWAVIRTNGPTLIIEKKNRPWSTPWHQVGTRTAPGAQGEYYDISNLVYFGGAYHVAYSSKFQGRDPSYMYALLHARFQAGLPDDYDSELVREYTPQGNGFPVAEMIAYRNKLVMAYQDELGWIRYARWDNADPTHPWVGNEIVAAGSTDRRPALGALNRRPELSANDYAVANYGNDLFAATNNFSDDRISTINFSRAIFMQEIQKQFDVYDFAYGYV